MNQSERRSYLIHALLSERPDLTAMELPAGEARQKSLLRTLLNIRPPWPAGEEFLRMQDAYLREETARKGVTDSKTLPPVGAGLTLWRGDITTLECDGIVNAANSGLRGCFVPCHGCIDNAIHTFAGVQLRLYCHRLMKRQGHEEPVGTAKLTPAYNLPCRYILHTVGPAVSGEPTEDETEQLASCYRSCLQLAAEKGLKSLAFCCISTGEFHFPNELAARIAVSTVKEYRERTGGGIEVIFNVYKQSDDDLYRELLGADQ